MALLKLSLKLLVLPMAVIVTVVESRACRIACGRWRGLRPA